MPVLRFKPGRVEEVLRLPLTEALEAVERLKIEAEVVPDGYVEMEVEVDRPDMYSLEGIARQVDGILDRARGLPVYNVVESGVVVEAKNVPTRPYVAAAVVWGVDVDEDFLEELIQFQEKLHASMGGRRELVAIGLHDYDKLPSKNIKYVFVEIDSVFFVPLGGSKRMSLRDVLEETEQGRAYGAISLMGDRHPVLYAGDEVISVPPVINAELTRIEPGTRNIFIDVTGVNKRLVLDTLAVLASNLAERSKEKKIGMVEVRAPWGTLREPDMSPRVTLLEASYASKVLGTKLDAASAAAHLERMRFSARPLDGDSIEVRSPRYRVDILHPVDLVEEIALSIGIEKLGYVRPRLMLRGRFLPRRAWEREARKLLAGMGFVELVSYSLVECERHSRLAGVDADSMVRISNPIGAESACLRASLLPQLLEAASSNQHNVPLKIFELGETYTVTSSGEKRTTGRQKLAILLMADKVGYEDIQGVVYALVRALGDEIVSVKEANHPMLIDGRAASVSTLQGLEAILGEVRPEILESSGIEYPVAVAEVDYTTLRAPARSPK